MRNYCLEIIDTGSSFIPSSFKELKRGIPDENAKNQKKASQKLARIDQKIVNQRENYQWKIAHKLVRIAEVLVFEDLNIQGMIRRCKAKQDELGRFLTERVRSPHL